VRRPRNTRNLLKIWASMCRWHFVFPAPRPSHTSSHFVLSVFSRRCHWVPYAFLLLPLISLGHCFRLIPAPGSFPASAFPVPPFDSFGPSQNAAACFGSSSPRFFVPQGKWGTKRRNANVLELSDNRRIRRGRSRREFLPLFNRIKRIDGRPERARTVDLHRVKFDVRELNPLPVLLVRSSLALKRA
jgi:hypothetical protein